MSRFGRTEKIILVSALLVFLTMSYFLYDDSLLFSKGDHAQLELIGKVKTSTNDVRRKNFDTFSWLPTSRKDEVFESDSIYTGDRSEAEIELNIGAQIRIEPNSLVTLNMKNGQMLLDLRYGNIKGEMKKGKAVTVKAGAETFILSDENNHSEKSKIQIERHHEGRVRIKVLSGKANVVNKSTGVKKVITPLPEVPVVEKSPLVQTPTPPVPLIEKPAINTQPVETVATPTPTPKPIQGPQFKNVQVPEGPTQEIILKSANNMQVYRQSPTAPMPFEWNAKGDFVQYEVEISDKADFSTIALNQKTSALKATFTDPLAAGKYFWRLKGLDISGKVLTTSKPHGFNLSYAPMPPPTPALVTKRVEFKTPSSGERRPASQTAPLLKWENVEAAKTYQVQISKDAQFSKFEKYDVKQTQTLWSQYHPGKYYFRVISRGPTGLTSPPSELGTMTITVEPIKLAPLKPVTLIAKDATPVLAPIEWTEIPFAKSYVVQLDKNADFSQPQLFSFTNHNEKLTIPEPGEYKVRVQALDEDNNPLTSFSNVQDAVYIYRRPLDPPSLSEPFNNASIFLQTEMEPFIWLEWKTVPGSVAYLLEISDRSDFSKILIRQNLTQNRYLIKDRVPLGTIYWRVRAIGVTAIENSSWAEKREFTIYHQKNEAFVK